MRRHLLLCVALAGLCLSFPASKLNAAEEASQAEAAEHQKTFQWHLINSLIFAAGFGYAVWKFSPAFFNARSAEIQKAIQDATGLKMQADFRHSEIDRKMATLPAEVQRMRQQSQEDMQREDQRRRDETQYILQNIADSLQAEIAAARQEGTRRIQRSAALMAIEAAERQLQERAGSGSSEGLVGDFVSLVERGRN